MHCTDVALHKLRGTYTIDAIYSEWVGFKRNKITTNETYNGLAVSRIASVVLRRTASVEGTLSPMYCI